MADPKRYAEYEAWLADQSGKPASPAADPVPEPTPENPENPPEEEQIPEGKKLGRVRIGFLQEAEQRLVNSAIQLARGAGLTFQEAYDRVTGRNQQQPGQQPPQTETQPTPPANPDADIDSRIADVRAKLKEAKAGFDTDAELDLLDQLSDLKAQKQMAVFRREQAENQEHQTAEARFQSTYQSAVDQAHSLFPQGADPNSEFSKAVAQEIQRLDQKKSPILDEPDYPLDIAWRVASRLGITPKSSSAPAAPASVAPKPQAPPAPARSARDVPPVVGGSATTITPMSRETMLASIDKMDAAELDRVAAALEQP